MGMCQPSNGFSNQIGRVGSLPRIWRPNSRLDLYDEKGKLLQQGWYGPDGRIIWYRDWSHGGGKHDFPHDHYVEYPRPPYVGPNGELTNSNFC